MPVTFYLFVSFKTFTFAHFSYNGLRLIVFVFNSAFLSTDVCFGHVVLVPSARVEVRAIRYTSAFCTDFLFL